jgi:alpha-tubulin suppressor-like RCC1 family protein
VLLHARKSRRSALPAEAARSETVAGSRPGRVPNRDRSNAYGQLGNGTTTDSSTPINVSGLSNAVGLGLGHYHACAVLADGGVQCWGRNTFGQLGTGNTTDSNTPVGVSGFGSGSVRALFGLRRRGLHLRPPCLLADSTAECWGANSQGQLGDGTTTSHYLPASVPGLSGATAMVGGFFHACL